MYVYHTILCNHNKPCWGHNTVRAAVLYSVVPNILKALNHVTEQYMTRSLYITVGIT